MTAVMKFVGEDVDDVEEDDEAAKDWSTKQVYSVVLIIIIKTSACLESVSFLSIYFPHLSPYFIYIVEIMLQLTLDLVVHFTENRGGARPDWVEEKISQKYLREHFSFLVQSLINNKTLSRDIFILN